MCVRQAYLEQQSMQKRSKGSHGIGMVKDPPRDPTIL